MDLQGSSEQGQFPFDWKRHMPLAPIIVSFLAIAVWLVFILLYALYWSTGFSWFQNIIVTIVSLLLVGLLIGLMWTVWGMKYAKSM
jgi:prepilin signal peptidase PulO-like enzyme (type II secretory pathway)